LRLFTYLILFYQLCFTQDKGLKSYNDGDYLTSRNYYQNILSKRKNDKEARFGLGASLFKTDSLNMAGELFRSLINSDDKELASMAAFNYANILKNNQKNKESLEYFKKAIKLNSKNKDAKINYELLKNLMNAQQDQSQQDQSQQDQSQQDQSQQDQSQQDQSQQDQSQQDQSQQDQSQQDQSETGKSKPQKVEDGENQNLSKNNRKMQAEAILDALKNEERVNKIRQIKSARSKTLEKDW
jgi:Ca-activated chloride channel homolog